MAVIILHWLVLEMITKTHHWYALVRNDNSLACSWVTHMSIRLAIAAKLVRALELRQIICQDAPMHTIHVAGEANDIVDIPSRSFINGDRWILPGNHDVLTRFTNRFPLLQGACW